jgi:2-polyprenyl-3-methyl-5-hydroxy-6-metoxy-1,4-benzoquinol methylase
MRARLRARPLDYCTGESFEILACDRCGYGCTVVPPGFAAEHLYETASYDRDESRVRKVLRPLLGALEGSKVRDLRRWVQSGALLEVGAGKGRFLAAARAAGFEVHGIEPSARSRAFSRALLGPVVDGRTLEECAAAPGRRYDVVYLWHVFEHLPGPDAALVQLRALLRPGGLLALAVPNFASAQAGWARGDWYHLDPPRHLHHFTPASLRALLERHAFEVLEVSQDSHFQNFLGETISLLTRISPGKNALLNALKSNRVFFGAVGPARAWCSVLWNCAALVPAALLGACLLAAARLRHRAGTLVIYARRR